MADNFAATPGTGATFGMDEVIDGSLGTVKVGFGKIMDGTLDSTNKLVVNASGEATVKDTAAEASLSSIDGKIPASPATSGKQDTGNTSVASIDTKTPALGQALAAASVPVILPSATITTLTPPAAITNFANETGGNLAAIKAKTDNIPAQGQALAAASTPVVLTAAQESALTPPAAITGFATSTKQSDGSHKTQVVDGSGNVIGATANALDVNIKSSSASGTEYTEDAAAAANPVGTVLTLIREDARAGGLTTTDGDNVAARGNNKGEQYVKATDSDALLSTIDADTSNISTKIDTIAGAVSGTEMQVDVLTMPSTTVTATNLDIRDIDSATDDITVHGDVGVLDQIDLTNSNPIATAVVDANGDQITSFGGGTQYSDADANADPTGTVAMGTDGANVFALHTDTAGDLQIDVLTMPSTTVTATDLDVRNLVFATDKVDASGTTLGSNSGVDVGDVTINNAAGVSAVNIQDGGNTITVDGAVTTSGTVTEANSGSILTSVQLIDDTIKTLGTDTYTETSTKGSVIGAVRRDANTTLVDTTNEVAPLQVNATGELKVAQIQPLPAGTNAIGKLAANDGVDIGNVDVASIAAGDNNIGNVDVVTLPAIPAGTNNIGDVDVLTVNGIAPAFGTGARGATVQRVTIATDDVVPITDNSGSLTVDAPVGTPAFVRLSDGAAAITTLPVSLASVPSHAVTNAGTFLVQNNATAASAATTSVANSVTNVTLLASNASRKSASIYNDDTAASLYVKLGATASATSFKIKIAPGGYFELPTPVYTGQIDGIATAATGSARISEES
jgi:hypothetical protein